MDAVVGSGVRREDADLQLGVRRCSLAQPPGDQRGEREVGIDGPARPLTECDLDVDTEAAERPARVGRHDGFRLSTPTTAQVRAYERSVATTSSVALRNGSDTSICAPPSSGTRIGGDATSAAAVNTRTTVVVAC